MKIIYICSAYGGDLQNYVKAKAYCREVIREGNLPVALRVFLPPLIQRGEGESKGEREYLLKPGYHYLEDCRTNTTTLIEHLKNVQRKGE